MLLKNVLLNFAKCKECSGECVSLLAYQEENASTCTESHWFYTHFLSLSPFHWLDSLVICAHVRTLRYPQLRMLVLVRHNAALQLPYLSLCLSLYSTNNLPPELKFSKKMFFFSLPKVPVVFNSSNTSALDDREGRQLMLLVHYHQMQVTLTSSFSTTLADNASRQNVWWAKTLLQRIHSVLDWFQKPKIVVQWTLQWVMGSQVLSTFVSRTSPLNTTQTECSASAHTHTHTQFWVARLTSQHKGSINEVVIVLLQAH